MAVLAVIRALDMCRPLTLRRGAVMATDTCSRNSGMIKYGRGPGCRGVAIITDIIARDVISRLAHGGGAVVTAFTGPVNGRMIHLHRGTPGGRRMTIVTSVGGIDVDGIFTGRGRPVVTTGAGTVHRPVIHLNHGNPGRGVMAIVARIGGIDMGGILARCRRPVMAGGACLRDPAVIKGGRGPAHRVVTIIAGIGARNMIGRFALCRRTVMTAGARSVDRVMINLHHRAPGQGIMTIVAGVAGIDMRGIFAGGCRPVMTGRTRLGNPAVVERRPGPADRRVTIVAGIRTRNMVCRFPWCRRIVVTAGAGSVDGRMVNLNHRTPRVRTVAVLTGVARIDVPGVLSRGRRPIMTVEA